MTSPCLCPHCGYSLKPDEPVQRGPWFVTPTIVFYADEPVAMTPGQVTIMHTLASAGGQVVGAEALGRRVGFSEDPMSIARVLICHARKVTPRPPIQTVPRHGYRWATEECAA